MIKQINSQSASISNCNVSFKHCVKYLGVKIDQTLSMHDQIGEVCRVSFLFLRRISAIRSYLSVTTTARLVCAFIISRLDYCNSVLSGLSSEQLSRLQRVQNCAARLVLRKGKRDHITPLLSQLHWLPVKYRIQYKLAVLAYHFFDETLPPYLSSVLSAYQPSRCLRSSYEKLLKVPKFSLKSVGERSFAYSAPTNWNALPTSVRGAPTLSDFKNALKTHLFQKAFM